MDGGGATVSGSTVTIGAAGTYRLTGALTDGQIVVDSEDEAAVRLILNGVDITNTSGAPIFIADSEEAAIVLEESAANVVTDAASYVFASADEDEPNAAIFSKSELTISGSGTLTVTGNYNDGIASKDGLTINGGAFTIASGDDGMHADATLEINAGELTVTRSYEGLASAVITINDGAIDITSSDDYITKPFGPRDLIAR